MELWTRQKQDFCIHGGSGAIDSRKGPYRDNPTYLDALREVAEYLGTDQFLWASKADSNWFIPSGMCPLVTHKLEVPEGEILAILDSFLWNLRLGNRVRPPQKLRDEWRQEANQLFPTDGQMRREYEDTKVIEWQGLPLPTDWLAQALKDGPFSEIPQFLLPFPISKQWVIKG